VAGGGLLSEALAGDNLVDEGAEDAHHGGAAVVELGVALAKLAGRLLVPVVPGSNADAVVSVELGGGPPGELDEAADEDDLGEAGDGNLEEAADALVDVGELEVVAGAEVAVEGPLVVVDEGAEHGHHGDAAVLALDGAVADEGLLIGDVAEGIEEAEGGDGADLLVELGGLELSGGSTLLGGGKRTGAGKEGGEAGNGLHFFRLRVNKGKVFDTSAGSRGSGTHAPRKSKSNARGPR